MKNTLYYGDNLGILREIATESVDLIYLDPPFNSKADYNILFKEPTGESSEAQITAFEDTWHWTDEAERTFSEIVATAPADVVEMMKAFRSFVGSNDMMAYLTMMCIRLLELHRVLKPTGSIYLHCDPTASHYLKIVLDAIFGLRNFQNEVIWSYRRWPSPTKHFQSMHDTLLFYSKSPSQSRVFNVEYEENSPSYIKRFKGKTQMLDPETGTRKITLDAPSKGLPRRDVWEISIIAGSSNERLGYQTQKPEPLLERLIQASSNEGDLVLDPFCGCGTTISAAQQLKRNWIGIDITHLAINLIKWRLKNAFDLEAGKDYKIVGEPSDLAGAIALSEQKPDGRYQFQWWALSLINARPYGDKKKGADTGIDGFIYFVDQAKDVKKVIVQVKSGKVSVKDIRDLGHVIDRDESEIGIFITLEEPTEPMMKESVIKGYYQSAQWGQFPRIQILTIEELLNGKRPNLPYGAMLNPFKKAERQPKDTRDSEKELELE